MKRYFEKGMPAQPVEVNKRSILADIELDSGAYAGKKVSRDELEAMKEELEGEDGESEMEEDGEDELEAGESELSESSESVAFDQVLKPRVKLDEDIENEEMQRKRNLLKKLEGESD